MRCPVNTLFGLSLVSIGRALVGCPLILGGMVILTEATTAQTSFGNQQVITTSADYPRGAFVADLDGDGDEDVLSASWDDNEFAWHENLGGQVFGSEQLFPHSGIGPKAIKAADLDGDSDLDVLTVSYFDGAVSWYENLGGGVFGVQQVINTIGAGFTLGASDVEATDLDGDGDLDVLVALQCCGTIEWYENQGGTAGGVEGTFGSEQLITVFGSENGIHDVGTGDLNGDGYLDVLSGAHNDNTFSWYENLTGGVFGAQQVLTTSALGAGPVEAVDLDGDGDLDVLGGSEMDHKVAWYENQGGSAGGVVGTFGAEQVLGIGPTGGVEIDVADFDGDGDMDVVTSNGFWFHVSWWENEGAGVFGAQQLITPTVIGPSYVHAADIDGDGDQDVLSCSRYDDKIAWYENLPAEELLFAGGSTTGFPGEVAILDSATFAASPLGAGSAGGAISGLACTTYKGVWAAAAGGADVLWKINPDTGAVYSSVPLALSTGGSPGNIFDLAVQPGTDTLFGCGGASNTMLYSIDESSGVVTTVGDSGVTHGGLAFAADGTLYGAFNDLYTLDPSTGAVLSSIPLIPHNGIHGLAVRPSDGALIATRGGTYSTDVVVRINPVTGQTTVLGSTGTGTAGDLDYMVPPPARCYFFGGTLGLNPPDYICMTEPILGETWSSSVSMIPTAGTTAVSTFVALGLGGPVSGVKVFGHELLILPSFLPAGPAMGSHNIPIPYMLSGAGVFIYSQGARIETGPSGLQIVLTNAQSLQLGL